MTAAMDAAMTAPLAELVGEDIAVACVDGQMRPYLSLDNAASTPALASVAKRVSEFLPVYSSVHRGAGWKSQQSTIAYEAARRRVLAFAGRDPERDTAIFCRNTTEAVNHLAYRLRLTPNDIVVTTEVEHHANMLPWRRVARCRYVAVGSSGTFTVNDVAAVLRDGPRASLLAVTGASNVTGWLPDLDQIIALAQSFGVPVFVDAAQLAPHQPLPATADYVAWSGHKMYAPYGTGVLIGPRQTFESGDPFLAGGGAVDLVALDEVVWTDPPDREEAGSPNVIGAIALHGAIDEMAAIGWPAIIEHERALAGALRRGLAAIENVRLLGPSLDVDTLAVASFVIDGLPHALVAARLSAEFGIGVRHGCFCAHPYLLKLLDLTPAEVHRYRANVLARDRREIPGAVRASAAIATTSGDIERFLAAVAAIANGSSAPVAYEQDPTTGDYYPDHPGWADINRALGASCARG